MPKNFFLSFPLFPPSLVKFQDQEPCGVSFLAKYGNLEGIN